MKLTNNLYLYPEKGMLDCNTFELGPIRPPSEAYSLLIRVTRNCPWNRCRFCHTYKGAQFQLRTVAEIKREIETARAIRDEIAGLAERCGGDLRQAAALAYNNPPSDAYRNVALWVYAGGESVFLQDANSLIMPTAELLGVIKFLKQTFPGVNRITSYARAKTAARKQPGELAALREAGLSRLHIGLETGYNPLLSYMDKGVTAAEHIAAGQKVVAAGISLCEYVILGLGGKKMWREHATETAWVLNQIAPDYIRVRTLAVNGRMALHADIEGGSFVRSTDEEIIAEERLLIERLECHSSFVSDHVTNLLQEIEGRLPQDRNRMLAIIDRFQGLEPAERLNFRVGRRIGIYSCLDGLADGSRHQAVERVVARLAGDDGIVPEEAIYRLTERFI